MKIEQEHTIEVVFERSCAQYGFEVVNWLEDTGIAKRIDHPADTSDVLNCYAFIAMQEIIHKFSGLNKAIVISHSSVG